MYWIRGDYAGNLAEFQVEFKLIGTQRNKKSYWFANACVLFSLLQSTNDLAFAQDTKSVFTKADTLSQVQTVSPNNSTSTSKNSLRIDEHCFSPSTSVMESARARSGWTKSTLNSLPPLDWQSILNSGKQTSLVSTKEGLVLLTSDDPRGRRWLVAINALPWTEQIECMWSSPPPKESELLPLTSLNEPQSLATKAHRADVERFQFTQKIQETLNAPSSQPVTDKVASAAYSFSTHDGWRFPLPAMSFALWSWQANEFQGIDTLIHSWSRTSSSEGVDLMTANVGAISEAIQRMTNFRSDFGMQMDGSFEVNEVDRMKERPISSSTWLFSLNPTTTWSNSSEQSHSPGRSLKYESSHLHGNGWIQTRAIPRRVKWPIVVAVWLKLDDLSPRPTVRLITTGTLNGTKVIESKQVPPMDVDEEAAGIWRRYEFPTLRRNATADNAATFSPSEMLSWTIEVSGPGKLWVDDMGMTPLLLTDEERRLIRSQLFVAKRELEQQQPMKALEWIESPLVIRILQFANDCPSDFLKPITRTTKPLAITNRKSFLQATNGWFWRPSLTDLEPKSERRPKGIRAISGPKMNR